MHLVINASDLGRSRGGNESYLLGLVAGLATLTRRAGRSAVRISLIVAREGVDLARSIAEPHGFDLIDAGPYRRLPFFLWQQTAILRRLRPDWYISTFFLPPVTPCRAAVLIHDLSFRAHPDYYPLSIAAYMRLLTGLAIRRAEVVVALSEFTQREIVRFYPAAGGKVAVVYPGIGAEFRPDAEEDDQALSALGVRPPYVLAVGNIHPRKNLGRLLDAWLRLPVLAPASDESRSTGCRAQADADLGRPGSLGQRRPDLPGAWGRGAAHRFCPGGLPAGPIPPGRGPGLSVSLRGVRPATIGGDGLRHAGLDGQYDLSAGGGGRRSRDGRPYRCRGAG